uniref:Putative ddb1 and cul4 associated factor 11 n=1 Tax=Ornithodoros turicata TaxID=34597 RepID=A0A2R5LNM0_9ACAR
MGLNASSLARMCDRPATASDARRNNENREYDSVLQLLVRSAETSQVRIRSSEILFQDDSDEEGSTSSISRDSLDAGGGLISRKCYFQLVSAVPSPDSTAVQTNDLHNMVKLQSGERNWRRRGPKTRSIAHVLQEREFGMPFRNIFSKGDKCRITSRLLPNQKSPHSLNYMSKSFCGTYARNGDIFMTACQDCVIRVYDSSQGGFREIKSVAARDVGWSILDMAVSPDGVYFVYSSWSEYLHLCNVFGEHEVHQALPLFPDDRRFCIFSLQFSSDGREILGGANDKCLYVYDREVHHRSLKIQAHEDDVNTVSFADKTSQILFSGGDDGLCKVWDRRMLSEAHPKPVGVLAGHRNGITYIDSKGDGRYLITNSKDQTIKLWDVRAFSQKSAVEATRKAVDSQSWDYRWQRVPKRLLDHQKNLLGDTSLMTYRGHTVLQTLIRCHFSPEATTGQQYIYTGCASGRVVMYDVLTGKVVTTLSGHRGCVRDVSWHPYLPVLVSTSWDGTVCEWIYNSTCSFTGEGVRYEKVCAVPFSSLWERARRLRF